MVSHIASRDFAEATRGHRPGPQLSRGSHTAAHQMFPESHRITAEDPDSAVRRPSIEAVKAFRSSAEAHRRCGAAAMLPNFIEASRRCGAAGVHPNFAVVVTRLRSGVAARLHSVAVAAEAAHLTRAAGAVVPTAVEVAEVTAGVSQALCSPDTPTGDDGTGGVLTHKTLVQISDDIRAGDRRLLSVISESMSEAARRSGAWLACRAGCTQCCIGPFAITQLDALRLRTGVRQVADSDPERAAAVLARAAEYVRATSSIYPGDPVSGELFDEDSLPESMDTLPCPALDPQTGCCDLYHARPITCRSFGPVTHVEGEALGACELCYVGATEKEMAACAVEIDPDGIESELIAALDANGVRGMTIVAYALQ